MYGWESAMQDTEAVNRFSSAYENNNGPWIIGEPQPAIVELERAGAIRGSVLDIGCGSGEHTLLLTGLGYDVLGVDFSPAAVATARANAADRGVRARFEAADALHLGGPPRYDTVIDSALFHVFEPDDQRAYARSLHEVVRPGGVVHVLVLSEEGPTIGPQVSDVMIRDAFADGWELEELRASTYRAFLGPEYAARFGLPEGFIDSAAWLASARRS
jgi:SAM-dependent methyltransferase